MWSEHLSVRDTMRRFVINDHGIIKHWEHIYLEEGPEGLAVERRGSVSTGRPRKLSKEVEEDMIAENQRLRAKVVTALSPYYRRTAQPQDSPEP